MPTQKTRKKKQRTVVTTSPNSDEYADYLADTAAWAVSFRRRIRSAVFPYYPNNPGSTDEELERIVKELVAFWQAQGSPEPQWKRDYAELSAQVEAAWSRGRKPTKLDDLTDVVENNLLYWALIDENNLPEEAEVPGEGITLAGRSRRVARAVLDYLEEEEDDDAEG